MGCVVNGPGEAATPTSASPPAASGGHLFVKGRNVAVVPEDEMVEALVEWAEFINEHGVEAALARADTETPRAEAEKDRPRCSTSRATTPTSRASASSSSSASRPST